MTTYSKTYNREQLAKMVFCPQSDSLQKDKAINFTKKLFKKWSADKVRNAVRKSTKLDILTISEDKFVIRYN